MKKINRIFTTIICSLIPSLTMYLIISFYKLNLNVYFWEPENRFLLILISVPFGILCGAYNYIENYGKN